MFLIHRLIHANSNDSCLDPGYMHALKLIANCINYKNTKSEIFRIARTIVKRYERKKDMREKNMRETKKDMKEKYVRERKKDIKEREKDMREK